MKKIFGVLLGICILLCCTPSFAAAQTFLVTLMDTEITVEIPEGYDALTRDLDQYADLLEKYNIDRTTLLTTMRNESRYLETINTVTGNEIMLTGKMDKNSINLWSYSRKKASMITKTAESLQRGAEEGLVIDFYATDAGYNFMRYTYGLGEPEAIVFSTVENGRNIEIGAYTYTGDTLTERDINALYHVVNSFRVKNMFPAPDQVDVPVWVFVLILVAVIVLVVFIVWRTRKKLHRLEEERLEREAKRVKSRFKDGVVYELLDGNEVVDSNARRRVKPVPRKRPDGKTLAQQQAEEKLRAAGAEKQKTAPEKDTPIKDAPKQKKPQTSPTEMYPEEKLPKGVVVVQDPEEAATAEPEQKKEDKAQENPNTKE